MFLAPPDCGAGMVYTECGNPCMPTCSDPKAEMCTEKPCEAGCFCEEGKVFNGDGECFTPEKCGCAVPGSDDRVNVGI